MQLQFDWDSSKEMREFLVAYGALIGLVSKGEWEGDPVNGPVRWHGDGEYGFVSRDDKFNRVRIIVSSGEAARETLASTY